MIESSAADDWDFYFCNVNDVLSSIMVNLGANRRAPMADKPWLLWVWVHMRSSRDDGLSSDTEAPKLYEIEDNLTGSLSESGAELLGRITGGDRREFYFYSGDSEGLDFAIAKVRQTFPDYLFECGKRPDPDWRQYLDVLYPSDADMQRIQNRRVVSELEKRGDVHSIARPIDHAIYFRSPGDRKAFAAAAVAAGFAVLGESDHDTDEGGRRYLVDLVRADPATIEHIDEVVLQLLELAKRYNADYDGWGCEVQTAAID